jgi:hypothetical protein
MTRDQLIGETKRLIAEGERLQANPSLIALRTWLQLSDELLARAWGTMDRYHLAWLMVGKPKAIVRGRPMTSDEEAAYVREVAGQKTAALRMSLDAVERQGMPFLGEEGGFAPGQGGAAAVPGGGLDAGLPPEAADLAARIREARERSLREAGTDAPRAPRPEFRRSPGRVPPSGRGRSPGRGQDRPPEQSPIDTLRVVVGERRHPPYELRAGPFRIEAEGSIEEDGDLVLRRDRDDRPVRAADRHVGEPRLVDRGPDPQPSQLRVRRGEVDDRLARPIGAQEAGEERSDPTVLRLRDPRRRHEVDEPRAVQEQRRAASVEPPADVADQPAVVVLDRVPERERRHLARSVPRAHRDPNTAPVTAKAAWAGTRMP